MSRSLGNQVPATLAPLLDGENVAAKTDLVFLLVTLDGRGYPHAAMLSVGEVLARGPGTLRLALYSSSATTQNLRRASKLTVALAQGGLGYYLKATAREVTTAEPDLAGLAVFDATVDEVLEDGEPIAQVTSGFSMTLTGDPARVVSMWEATIRGLRAVPDA